MLKQMLTSKKFVAAAVGVLIALAAKLGLELDTEGVLAIISPILAYVLGQGIADHGKERAKQIVEVLPFLSEEEAEEQIDGELRL